MKKKSNWFDKLTEAERAIWKLIYYHPTFITNRSSALDLLFCCIGTGLKWIDGEIKDTVDDNYLNSHKRYVHAFDKDIYEKAYCNTFDKSFTDRLEKFNIKMWRSFCYYDNCVAEYTLNNIEKLVTNAIPLKYFYPICEYSNLLNVPGNVKPDWLDLAIETCDLILITDPLYKCPNGRLQNEDNIKIAKKQKAKLLKMKKARSK